MAISDEIREQRQKLKGQGAKAHLSYFMTYYKYPTLAAIAVIAMVISIVHSIATNKPSAISAIFLNASNPELTSGSEWIDASFCEYAGIDTEEYSVTIDTSSYLTPGGATSQMEMGTTEKIMAYAAAKDLDVLMADPYNFQNYAKSEMYIDLRTVLTEEQQEKYEPYYYYVDGALYDADVDLTASEETADTGATTQEEAEAAALFDDSVTQELIAREQKDVYVSPDPSEMEDPIPVGVIMTDAPYLSSIELYGNTVPVLGIVASSERTETAVLMLEYLWDH
ncbi:MAG: hypothetical protein Q4C60_06600 [Eubacteriales bacterium]|nr:hypothetical protein [Eubacteriales bacterium]